MSSSIFLSDYCEHKALFLNTKASIIRSCQRFSLAASNDICNLHKTLSKFCVESLKKIKITIFLWL